MELTVFIGALSKGSSFFNFAKSFFKDMRYETYFDIASAHFNSAEQAFISAENSKKNYTIELLDAISHLRDAYNIYNKLLERKKVKRFLFIEIGERKCLDIHELLLKVSALIGLSYSKIGEITNSNYWKTKAVYHFDLVVEEKIAQESITITEIEKRGGYGATHSYYYTDRTYTFDKQLNIQAKLKYKKQREEISTKI